MALLKQFKLVDGLPDPKGSYHISYSKEQLLNQPQKFFEARASSKPHYKESIFGQKLVNMPVIMELLMHHSCFQENLLDKLVKAWYI